MKGGTDSYTMNTCDLVIIGNGFDMNHVLDTSYRSFYNYLPSDLRTEWEKNLNKYDIPNDTCYNFEEIINIITNECFELYFNSTYLSNVNQDKIERNTKEYHNEINKINQINQIFKDIYSKFQEFITDRNGICETLNDNISNIIGKNTQVISFNYTNLVKAYSNKVCYIHGSIDEKFIVFGYSIRKEYDSIDPKAAMYDKHK